MRKHYTTLFITIVMSCAGLFAQTLYVKETNDTQNSYTLSIISKISFLSGDSMLVKTNNGITTYSLNKVSYFNFTNLLTAIPQNAIQKNDLLLFPNPVNDELKISYKAGEAGVLNLEIIDMQGKVVLQQSLSGQNGNNLFTINVTQLLHGLYLCRVQNSNQIENLKFIKD